MNPDQRPDRVKFVTSGQVTEEPGADGAGLVLARTPGSDAGAAVEHSSFWLLAVVFTLGCAIGGALLAGWSALTGPLP